MRLRLGTRAGGTSKFILRNSAPAGFIYLTDTDGSRLTDPDGAYLMEAI